MSLSMTREEREAFLADLHVGVISIERAGQTPLTVPIWYDYDPGVGLWVITHETSQKGRALEVAGRYALCAQVETPPVYRYVSIEGPIVAKRPADLEKDLRPMAHRYFGAQLGDQYLQGNSGEGDVVYTMAPKRWRTVDYAKLGQAG